jgi:hypothetical protein
MGNTAVSGYTDIIGKHGLWIGDHTGPASYAAYTAPATGGDVISATNFGLRSLDMVVPLGYSVSGSYAVKAKLATTKAGGSAQSAVLVWYAVTWSSGVEVLTEVAGAFNLSGETVRLLVVGG